jgi:rubrerythrin
MRLMRSETKGDRPMTDVGSSRAGPLPTTSRAALLRRFAVAAGAAVTAGGVATALPKFAASADPAQDDRILNYVLRLEYLQAAFYAEAAEQALEGELRQLAQVLAGHERTHVEFLRKRLGAEPASPPSFDFGDATSDSGRFAQTAQMVEETAVAAYIGQGANVSRRLMIPFAQMTSVEARHAAWIADILERDPAPRAADKAKSPDQVRAALEELGFEVPA